LTTLLFSQSFKAQHTARVPVRSHDWLWSKTDARATDNIVFGHSTRGKPLFENRPDAMAI
jgi:hypothetical protein